MATSRYEPIPVVVKELRRIAPVSVLDIGVGFGSMGFLIREYLEAWDDRVCPSQWKIQVDGVEIFPAYHEGSFQKILYSSIWYGDAREYPYTDHYDLLTCFDVIEHLPKTDGVALLRKFLTAASEVFVSIPVGPGWLRKPYGQNPHEAHISEWSIEDVCALGYRRRKEYSIPDGRRVGMFLKGVR